EDQVRIGLESLVAGFPVDLVVVLAAQPVVVHPGHVGHAGVQLRPRAFCHRFPSAPGATGASARGITLSARVTSSRPNACFGVGATNNVSMTKLRNESSYGCKRSGHSLLQRAP